MNEHRPDRAVLFLATGSATSPDEIAGFITDIREGRPPSPELLAEVQHRYQLIGGSPFMRITLAQSAALSGELMRRGIRSPVFNGMCHCEPRIRSAVERMKQAGIEHAIAIILAPLFSPYNRDRYARRLDQAQRELGTNIAVRWIESWWRQPRFIEAWSEHIQRALGAASGKTKLIFTAHSLPARVEKAGDRYADELKSCAAALAERVGFADWDVAFQSAGASPEPWLGPSLKECLGMLPSAGYERLVVAPIGFVCDNAEILFDLDIEANELARASGIRLARVETMNESALFIAAVADALEGALE